jgi:DNA-binding HxlR family transcriptional regulator
MSRDYGQYCGLARALDVVGDRWNLLIVRELLIGPARYGELRDGLSGIATNLLTDRLRDLETAGVIERRLSDDANAITYVLTPWGAQLREPINALIRWSTPLMIRGPEGDEFRADGLLVALPALFAGRIPTDQSVAVGITVDGVTVQLRAADSGIAVDRPDGRKLDGVLTADAQLVLGLAAGVLSLDDIAALVDIDGDESALRTFFDAPKSPANFTR